MRKIIISIAIVVLTAWSQSATAEVNLTAETASPGGTTFLSPSHLVEVAATHDIANIQLTEGQTLTNSVQNVAEGKTDIAATPFLLPFLLKRAVGPYGSLSPEEGAELAGNLRVMMPYAIGYFFLSAYESKNIAGWEDLKGRKIYNGPARGGALNMARSILNIASGLKEGEDYEGIQVNWGKGAALVISGEPDALIVPMNFGGTGALAIGSAGRMTSWSVPKATFESPAMQTYMAMPGQAPFTTPVADLAGTMGPNWQFSSEDETFRGVAMIGGTVVNKNMDSVLVYELTSTYIATLDGLKSKAPYGKSVGFDLPMQGMCGANPLKYHPAAARAWRDAGFEVDDCALPPGE